MREHLKLTKEHIQVSGPSSQHEFDHGHSLKCSDNHIGSERLKVSQIVFLFFMKSNKSNHQILEARLLSVRNHL